MPCYLRDLLHRRDSLYWNCDFAARVCFASFIFAFVSAPVRARIRCVGDLRATRVLADGVKTLDREVADMAKTDLRDYSFADVKVTFPHAKVAVITYKATQHATSGGQDVSGTYNSGSVWIKGGGKWAGVFHTETKTQ